MCHGAGGALQPLYRCIRIHTYYQFIAIVGGTGQQIQVAMVQYIEAAIGEYYLMPHHTPAIALTQQGLAGEYLTLYPLQLVHGVSDYKVEWQE